VFGIVGESLYSEEQLLVSSESELVPATDAFYRPVVEDTWQFIPDSLKPS
jgi:hypothetical protein